MQPLKILTNVQKARLLHALFYNEMPLFLTYLKEVTEQILADRETVRANWKDTFFTVDLWLSFAEDVQAKLAGRGKDLTQSSAVFSEQLFGNYTALYMIQQMANYGETSEADPKFIQAVDLLFV